MADTSSAFRLMELPPVWAIVLVVLPLVSAVAWLGYRREPVPSPWRLALAGIRSAILLLLLFVLARPVRVETREEVRAPVVAVLVDDSASMGRADAYVGDDAARQALTGLGLPAGEVRRVDLARAVLGDGSPLSLPALLLDRGYDVRLFSFGDEVRPLASPTDLAARSPSTRIGDAVGGTLNLLRGEPVNDLLVISDGRNNAGLPMGESARLAGAAGIPVHTLVLGDPRAVRNARIEVVEAPDRLLEGDEVGIVARVVGVGFEPGTRAEVLLEEIEPDGSARLHMVEEVTLDAAGERLVLVAPARTDGFGGQSERRLRLVLTPMPGESTADDNRVELGIPLTRTRIRVLYVEGYPRWEYRYLKNLLLRADANLDVQCVLLSATADFPQESSAGMPPLPRVPTGRAELLAGYDVVILGDVNPYAVSSDPARAEEFPVSLRAFVEAGGGLLFQAGEFDNPRSARGTPLADLLPVVLDPTGTLAFGNDGQNEFRPRLENPADPHPILRLHPDPETNRALWEDPGGLRGFYWYAPVRRARPGSQVLLRHPVDQAERGAQPLLVLGYVPQGRTMFLGVDSTWMWRHRYGDRYHERFWRNAIRWLALGRLTSSDRRTRLEATRSSYRLDERVVLEARVLDTDFQPSREPNCPVVWSGPDGLERTLVLEALSDRAGVYRGSFRPERQGLHRARIERSGASSRDDTAAARTEFEISLPSIEAAEPAPDGPAMAELARATLGTAWTVADLPSLLGLSGADTTSASGAANPFPGGEERREPIASTLTDAWDRLSTLFALLALGASEWILRKRLELV